MVGGYFQQTFEKKCMPKKMKEYITILFLKNNKLNISRKNSYVFSFKKMQTTHNNILFKIVLDDYIFKIRFIKKK